MERTVTATEARVRFGELIRRVAGGQGAVVVEKDGEPAVVILSLEDYARLKAGRREKPDWQSKLEHAHKLIAADLGDRRLPDVAQLIREMREDRDAQLLGLR